MVALGVLIIIALFAGPLLLAIVALVQASAARRQVDDLSRRLTALQRGLASPEPIAPASPALKPAPPPPPLEVAKPISPQPIPVAAPPPVAAPLRVQSSPPSETSKPDDSTIEMALGSKVASFVGITAVVIAIAFFVVYAVQHNWIGPAMRVLMGLVAGIGLVGAGHILRSRGEQHIVLSLALVGGGSALFYYSVFAAYAVYGLIGGLAAAIGLAGSAVAVVALALLYDSQAVGVLGVLGAFSTPLLVAESELGRGLFPLVYAAIINFPVLVLSVRRDWKGLPNVAFLFTVIYVVQWFDSNNWGHWRPGLAFIFLYYAQFVTLGFFHSTQERADESRWLDVGRISVAAFLLGVAIYSILHEVGHESWCGGTFAALAVAHAVLAVSAKKNIGELADEALAFASAAVGFAAFALPIQFDGAWVSLGWSLEGVALVALAIRARSASLKFAAVALGLLGVMKAIVFDPTIFTTVGSPFRNSPFAVKLLASALLSAQAWQLRRAVGDDDQRASSATAATFLNVLSVAAVLLALTLELGRIHAHWVRPAITIFWALSAFVLTGAGLIRRVAWLRYMGLLLFGLAVLKAFVIDLGNLRGLPRIAAFFGLGVLLLALSFVYQRVAPVLMNLRSEPEDES